MRSTSTYCGCTVVMSMFVSSKWHRVAHPTRWRASVRARFYCYLTFLDHRTNISRKVRAPMRVSASGAPSKFQIVTWTKQTWTKHHNTDFFINLSFLISSIMFSYRYPVLSYTHPLWYLYPSSFGGDHTSTDGHIELSSRYWLDPDVVALKKTVK